MSLRSLNPTHQNPSITELALFDVVPVVKGEHSSLHAQYTDLLQLADLSLPPSHLAYCLAGVAADISHVDTPAVVTGYTKDDEGLKAALTGAQIVVIPAGVPRKVRSRSLAVPLSLSKDAHARVGGVRMERVGSGGVRGFTRNDAGSDHPQQRMF